MLYPCVALLLTALAARGRADHCYPGMSCWPQYQDFLDFTKTVDGDVYFQSDEHYYKEVLMYNTRVTRHPYIIVMVESTDDVIATVKFANKFKIRLTIRSSGHDYIGRATADGSVQINLKRMEKLWFKLHSSRSAAGEVTAESGNTWLRVYNESHKYQRTIVGGSAHTVSMGGYTLGGGHSPIGRKFGMAVDNLLDVEMVTSNGTLVYANATTTIMIGEKGSPNVTINNGDLFWALRGGGGSTFGIVTKFTFKLHPDSKMVSMLCGVPYVNIAQERVGEQFGKDFNQLLATTLPPEWGGYEFYSGQFDPNTYTLGSVAIYLNHFGEWGTPTFNAILPFLTKYQDKCKLTNYSSFLDYEMTANDPLYYRSYIMNVLMQPDSFTDDFYNFVFNLSVSSHGVDGGAGCTGTLIGGNMHATAGDATAVNPSFRTGVMSLSCGMSWDSNEEQQHVAAAERLTQGFLQFGHGTYFNEPSAYMPNWQRQYWGSHYDRLLVVKQRWDPTNVFSCFHCVGSELKDGLTANPSTIVG